jgi:hypothetical protein
MMAGSGETARVLAWLDGPRNVSETPGCETWTMTSSLDERAPPPTASKVPHGVSSRRHPSTWLTAGILVAGLGMVAFLLVANTSPDTAALPNRSGDLAEAALIGATIAAWLSILVIGAILAALRPHNPIGWLLLVGGFSTVYTFFAEDYVQRAVITAWPLPAAAFIDWILPLFQRLSTLLIAFWVPLVFPDGRLPGRRWRPLAWVVGVAMTVDMVLQLLTDSTDEFGRRLPNPTAIGGDAEVLAELLSGIASVIAVIGIVVAFVSVIARFAQSSGIERQQLKWFLASVGLVLVSLIGMTVSFVLGVELLATTLFFVNQILVGLPPVAIGIAVLRFRLYEIDRLISRTIGWALVTGILVAVFVGVVFALQALLAGFTQGDTLAVAASTLAAFALFQPLRRRSQVAVDRRFDRARYDGQQTVDGFAERLRDQVDLESIRAEVPATVDAAMRPTHVGVWLRERQGPGNERGNLPGLASESRH